ncbi:MAG: hexose kinase [Chitinivibrionales bacterium]|nr:hexose kinase [Chitinivibrionales bacterium]
MKGCSIYCGNFSDCNDDKGHETALLCYERGRALLITCTVFNPCLDVTYSLDEFHVGNTYNDTISKRGPAGKGINVARAIKELGEDVGVVIFQPEENHGRFKKYFEDCDIDAKYFTFPGSVRINTTICERAAGRTSHINSLGTAAPPEVQNAFIKFIEQKVRKDNRLALCGSLPPDHDMDAYRKVITALKKKSVFCLLDSRGDAFRRGLLARPDAVKPNHEELEEYFGEEIRGIHHIALKGKRFCDMGIRYAFISLGSDGMIAIHDNNCLLCSVPPITPVDTIGCGDSVVAGILVGMQRKLSFVETCRLAVACGISNALNEGAGIINKGDVQRLMKDICIESV